MAFEDFKREIVNTVRQQEAALKLSAIEGDEAYVLVNANSRDNQVTRSLQLLLDQQGMGYDTADEHDNIEKLVDQYDFQGLVVIYGQCEQPWAKQQVRLCRQLLLKKKQHAPVCAIYIGPPDAKPNLDIRLPNVPHLSYQDQSTLLTFLRSVQERASEGSGFMTTSSPYPGLRPFQRDEAHLFFGREVQIEDMLARLEHHRFLAVIGTSGCGKSSLVRAGLIPALEQGFLSDAEPHWRIAVMRPGSAPFDHLTTELLQDAALGRERRHTSEAVSLLQATLRRGPLGLVQAVQESHLPEGANILLLVDQFEEIFRYREQATHVNDADAFVSLLLASAQSRQSDVPIYVVITMRSDFIGDCALFPGLPEAINDSQLLTPRLTRDQYRAAIVEPAQVEHGQLAEPLVHRLLNDLRGEPDQLPVLQRALMRMWTQTADEAPTRMLTIADYENVGGLTRALSKHCDEILYNALSPAQQRLAEVMFRALCERGSDQLDTRRPVQLEEVAAIAGVEVEAVHPVVDAFRGPGRNLLMPPLPMPLHADTTLDISHESLIRQWHTLNTWVTAEMDSARQYQRLEDAAKRRLGGEGAELWRGVDLENARDWKAKETPTQAWASRYGDAYQPAMDFLEASEAEEARQRDQNEQARQRELDQARELAAAQRARAEEQAARASEQARAAKQSKVIAIIIGVLLLVMSVVAIFAIYQQNVATKAQQHAEEQEQEAMHAAKDAATQRQAAAAAAGEAKRQQEVAEQKRQIAKDQHWVALVRLARYFSAVSKAHLESQPTLSVLFGVEAVKVASIPVAEEALRNAIAKIDSPALVGHEDRVVGVAFSPDGQRLATTSWDKTVRLWSLSDPTSEPIVLRGHEDRVVSVAFSPDGQRLATTSWDKTVRLWSLSDPTSEPTVLRGHEGEVYGVAFSPDGQLLATTSWDDTVRLWSLSDRAAEPTVLRGHEGEVYGVAFSPDGQLLATTSRDKTVRLWSLSDRTAELKVLRGHEGDIWGVAFSPDGQVLATASQDKTVRLWPLSDRAVEPTVLRGHEGGVDGVAFSPDGQRLATASWDDTVRLWSLNDLTVEPEVLRGHESDVDGVAFSPDGQRLATASWDKTVQLWSLNDRTKEPEVLRGHEDRVVGVAFSPDGQVLATTSRDHTVRLWLVRIDDLIRIACRSSGRNFSYQEWQQFLSDEPYRQTCRNRPLHPSFLDIVRRQIKNGDVQADDAIAQLRNALQGDRDSDGDLEKEARRLAVPALVEKGRELAQKGEIDAAIATFNKALGFIPELDLHPLKETRRLAATTRLEKGQKLAQAGKIKAAITAFADAQASDPNLQVSARAWNTLCWFGSLDGFATDVMTACEQAIVGAPNDGGFRHSRGVARALIGDYLGAVEDLQRFVEWGPENGQSEEEIRQRREWIRILQANQNPFNEELLQQLREQ